MSQIWAASWQKQQNGMCAQWWLRSAWASAQSDQFSLPAWRKLGSLATYWAHSEDSDQTGRMPRLIWLWSDWADAQTDLSLSWAHSHFVGFVVRRPVVLLIFCCLWVCGRSLTRFLFVTRPLRKDFLRWKNIIIIYVLISYKLYAAPGASFIKQISS